MCAWGPVIEPRSVFRRDRRALLELVAGLEPQDWERPTICAPWRVRDLVAHLVGDDLGRLSRSRDGNGGGDAPQPGESFPAFIARLNHRWVTACSGMSPTVLVDLLTASGEQVLDFWDQLDLTELGEPVSWAGPGAAPRWLDCARDFTEYWTHQRQLREATGRAFRRDTAADYVTLDTFLRAMPYTLRDVHAPEGATVTVDVLGPAGGRWSWERDCGAWAWRSEHPERPTAVVTLDEDVLWRLCTRGITPSDARSRALVEGPAELTDPVLTIVSIIH